MGAKTVQSTLDFDAPPPIEQRPLIGLSDARVGGPHYGAPLVAAFSDAVAAGKPAFPVLERELRSLAERGIEPAAAALEFAKEMIQRYTHADTGFRLQAEPPGAEPRRSQLWGAFANAVSKEFSAPIDSVGPRMSNILPAFFGGLKAAAEGAEHGLAGRWWDTVLDVAFREAEKERRRRDPDVRESPRLHGGQWNDALEALTAVVASLAVDQKQRWADKLPSAARARVLSL